SIQLSTNIHRIVGPRIAMTDPSEFTTPIYTWIADVEDLELYDKGEYHPIHIGDELHNGRYRIVHKLGYGSYSTVWLVRDQQQNRYALLKVVTADGHHDRTESQILHHVKSGRSWRWPHGLWKALWGSNYGGRFVLEALDEFEIQGPNGNHWCVVNEPLAPSLSSMLEYLEGRRLPSDVSRKVAAQLTQGLSYLHSNGIVHGDLHEGSLLFRIPGMDLWTTEEVHTYLGEPDLVKVTRRDGQPAPPAAPEYIVRPPDPEILIPLCLKDVTCTIQIVNFRDIPKRLGTPVWFAAPEVLFLDPVGPPSDVWALTCLLYKILSGRRLFTSFNGDQDEVLTEMVRILGNLPDCWWKRWEKRSDEIFQPAFSGHAGDTKTNLHSRLQVLPTSLKPEEMSAFEEMLRGMLRFEPSERISAEQVVQLLPSSWNVPV
ncbi:kinase-like protein, partial [Wilcoxina mikolae CBS 423.85]